jgi:hypothetical protein
MFFLLRMAFWLGVVLVLLPSGGSQPTRQASNFNTVDAISAASATVADMRHFCERQPQACEVGSQAAVAIGHRAQAGAKMLYEFLSDRLGPTETGSVDAAPRRVLARDTTPSSQHTLRPADLRPAWRGPPPIPRSRI